MENYVEYVTISEITEFLKVRRNFIYERILPEVEHQKIGMITRINKNTFCKWLEDNTSFARQTILLPKSEVKFYAEKFKKKYPSEVFNENIEGQINNRSKIPFRMVKSFDLWEKAVSDKLIHPKLFKEYGYKDEEGLYREMFKRGAIKISLGRKKTFFFVPEISEEESFLCPAIDETLNQPSKKKLKTARIFGATIKAEGDSIFLNNLLNILRHHYIIEKSNINPTDFTITAAKIFYENVDGN